MRTTRFRRFTCVFLLVATSIGARADVVTRGPYLQNVSTTAATLRWRTDVDTGSRVWLGTQPDSLALAVTNTALVTDHEVRLTGLAPGARYYYAIGSDKGQLSTGSDHYIQTAPSAGEQTRIWVLGDAGTGTSDQLQVRDAYYSNVGTAHTDILLMLGDNVYNDGTDAEYQSRLFDVYRGLLRRTPLWPTLGNHDGNSASSATQSGPYFDVFTLPRAGEAGGVASGTEAYYSFNFGNIHFVCLNSHDVSRAADGPMLTWLRSDLAANARDWLVVFFHHPPYSKGSHDSDVETRSIEMRSIVLPVLERWGVDLVLSGHSHSYERSKLLNGHYGLSSSLSPVMVLDAGSGRDGDTGAYQKPALGPVGNAGAVYAVAGASGQVSGGTLNHPVMYASLNVAGSMVIDVNGGRLDATYLDSAGAVRDRFTINKYDTMNVAPVVTNPGAQVGTVGVATSLQIVATDANNDPLSYSASGLPAGLIPQCEQRPDQRHAELEPVTR